MIRSFIIIWIVFFLVLGLLAMACDLSGGGDLGVDNVEVEVLDTHQDASEYRESEDIK